MKLARIVNPALQTALTKLAAEKLPLKTAFKLKGIVAKVNEELQKYDEVRYESLKVNSKKDENGEMIIDDQKNIELTQEGALAFAKDLAELTSLDLEIPTITVAELGDNTQITADDLGALDGIIVDA